MSLIADRDISGNFKLRIVTGYRQRHDPDFAEAFRVQHILAEHVFQRAANVLFGYLSGKLIALDLSQPWVVDGKRRNRQAKLESDGVDLLVEPYVAVDRVS